MTVHDMLERSIPAMPALRELKKSPTPGCGQARGKPAGTFWGPNTTRRLWQHDRTSPYCQLHAMRDGSRTSQKAALSLTGPSCPKGKTPREFRRRVVVNALAGGQRLL
jgi:hypothetical protein